MQGRAWLLLVLAGAVLIGTVAGETFTLGFQPALVMDDIGAGGGAVNNYTLELDAGTVNATWAVFAGAVEGGPYTVLDGRKNESFAAGTMREFHIGNVASFRYYFLYLVSGFPAGVNVELHLNETVGGAPAPLYSLTPYFNWTMSRRGPLAISFNLTEVTVGNYTVTSEVNKNVVWYLFGTNTSAWLGSKAAVTQVDTQTEPLVAGTGVTHELASTKSYNTWILWFESGLSDADASRLEVRFGSGIPVAPPSGNPPNSTFTPSGEVTGCDPKSVTFTDTSGAPGGTPTAWVWNATNITGNNTMFTFSNLQSPVHSFGIGNFTINLTSSNAFGENESWQVTWINVSGVCPATTPVPIYGVSDRGIDAPVEPAVPALGVMVAVIVSVIRKRRSDRGRKGGAE